jgi:hypothetical protein
MEANLERRQIPAAIPEEGFARDGDHAYGSGRNRAERTVRMVGDDGKQRSDSLIVSQTHVLRPNR